MTMKEPAAFIFILVALSTRTVLGQWPCPNAEDIAPCLCSVDENTLEMDMECNKIETDEQLSAVFKSSFPFTNMRRLHIVRSKDHSDLQTLKMETFDIVTFQEIYISKSNLQEIKSNAFDTMNETLVKLQIQETEITYFPFEKIPTLHNLNLLQLANNKIATLTNLVSNSLIFIDLTNNEGMYFGENSFTKAPNLVTINLSNVGVQHIPPDLFASQKLASTIDLSYNELTTLETDDFHFADQACKKLSLNDNNIASIDPETFRGLHKDFVLDLENNKITDLPENVFLEVFEIAVSGNATKEQIRLKGNPLSCGCNLKWLILNDLYMAELKGDTACEDGQLVSDVPQNIIIANCP